MLRIVPHTVPRVSRSYEHFPDGFELHLLRTLSETPDRVQNIAAAANDEAAALWPPDWSKGTLEPLSPAEARAEV